LIGAGVIIKQGVKIGDGAVVGMGSIVTKDVLPYTVVGGCTAKIIKNRFDTKIIDELLEIKWWEFTDKKIENYAPYFTNPREFINRVKK
jgi:serine acetyltransferase